MPCMHDKLQLESLNLKFGVFFFFLFLFVFFFFFCLFFFVGVCGTTDEADYDRAKSLRTKLLTRMYLFQIIMIELKV